MPLCFIDIETRSRAGLRNGLDRYFAEAELILIQWAVDNEPVYHVKPLMQNSHMLDQLRADPAVTFVAHNAEFDMTGLNRLAGWNLPPERWMCTRVQAYAHGLPGGLDGLGNTLGVPDEFEKIKDGKRLIQKFCVPKKDGIYVEPHEDPGEWAKFIEYGRRDVERLREIYRRLPSHNYRGVNLQYFWLNAAINERGFAVDLPLIEATTEFLQVVKRESDAEISQLTSGSVSAITQRDKLLLYLTQNLGLSISNLRKSELETALQADDLSPEQRLLIESRLEGSRASGAKYKRALAMHVGGRLRFTQQCSGAGRTGRTAHKGFQPGNMPRAITFNGLAKTLAEQHVPMKATFIDEVILPMLRAGRWDKDWKCIYGGPNTAAANALRHTIIAEPGNELTVADYKNIESRLLAWMAGETWKLTAYNAADRGEKIDAYKMQYALFFGGDPATLGDHERQAGKVIDLACFAADTEVMTHRGYVRIVNVLSTDLLWDGVEWVRHRGLVVKGVQPVVNVDGIEVTASHQITDGRFWLEASELALSRDTLSRCLAHASERLPFSEPRLTRATNVDVSNSKVESLISKPVYDIAHAGPRNRFMVRTNTGHLLVHNCGFGGSVGAVVTMAVGYGMDLSILPALVLPSADSRMVEKADKAWFRAFLERKDFDLDPEVFMAVHVLVQAYRKANSAIDQLKRRIGKAVRTAVEHPGTLHEVGRCKIWANADVLIVELPTGYRLNYWSPLVEIETVIDPEDGEEEEQVFLSFKRARGAKMIRERSWPGLTLENIIQAMGNQVFRHGKIEVEKEYPGTLILGVHDEAIAEAPIGKIDFERYCAALCKGWHWSQGLPLAADGWQGPRFGKRG